MKMKRIFTWLIIGILLTWPVVADAQNGLIISEVADPADDYHGRFIEVFNAGPGPVDFTADTFYLSRQSNGGTGWGDVQLVGTVSAGETFVIGTSSFESIYGFVPDQQSGILIGNGDDAWFLFRNGDHTTGTLYDIYGAIDTDGTGEPWEYEDSRAVRVEGIEAPRTTWLAAEWDITPADVADTDPGVHHDSSPVDTLSPGDFSLAVQNDTFQAGQPVEVNVMVSELTLTDDIISYQFDVGFDQTVLEYTGCEIIGTIAEGGEIAVNPNIAGQLSVSYMNLTPLLGTGAILRIQFNSLALDTCEISLSNAWLNNTQVSNVSNGIIIIREIIPPSADITYSDSINRFADTLTITATFSEMMDAMNAVHLNLSGAAILENAAMSRQSETVYTYHYQVPRADGMVTVSLSNGTDMWGNEVIPDPTSGSTFQIIKFTPGDVDDDGMILAYDAAITLQYSVGLDPLTEQDPLPWEPWRDSTANVDGTGDVTAYDAGLILQFSAGIITDFSGQANKSLSNAEIFIDIVDNEIIFYSYGQLVGLNISTANENNILGFPVVLDERFISAFNIYGTTYNIGLCTATPPEDGLAIMKIPFYGNRPVNFKMIVNAEEKTVKVNLTNDIPEHDQQNILVYPNPAGNRLLIKIEGPAEINGYYLKIFNQLGSIVFESRVNERDYMLDLSDRPDRGLFFLQLTDSEGRLQVSRKIILK